jgi:hypothetical protein
MGRPLSSRCDACGHPPRHHHRDSCDGRYLYPLRFASCPCACANPFGLRKRRRRRTAWRELKVSATTVQTIGTSSLLSILVVVSVWYLEMM